MVRSFRSPALVALACSLLLVACGSDEPDTATPAPSVVAPAITPAPDTSNTSTTEPPPTDEQAVLAAVDCYWATLLVANDPPNPDHPGYQTCFTGDARARAIASTLKNQQSGYTARDPNGVARSGTRIISITATDATVAECFVDDGVLTVASTGAAVNSAVSASTVEFDLERSQDGWQVSKARSIEKWEMANTCPTD